MAGAVALACVAAVSHTAMAADDEEEEDSIETKIMKAILGVNDGAAIDYRERAPLVVPPSMNLVPPQQAKVDNPAWPKDADVQERKKRKEAAKRAPRRSFEEEGKPLTPAELERGRAAGGGRVTSAEPRDAESEGARPLRPNELGTKGSLWDMFKGKPKEETAVFKGEPARANLTDPPPGYMTPSPSHPYGITASRQVAKPYNLENKGVDSDGISR
jgi:type IV secretory pathway VirB10-like protein